MRLITFVYIHLSFRTSSLYVQFGPTLKAEPARNTALGIMKTHNILTRPLGIPYYA